LRAALREHGDNVSEAARALGVSRMTIYRLMVRFGLRGYGDEARRNLDSSAAPAT
jgi:DNA-binding MurR/RpiR family transcriptional regulator